LRGDFFQIAQRELAGQRFFGELGMAAGENQLDARVKVKMYRLAVVGDGGDAPLLDVIQRQQRGGG
jgi:hypothetical protein